MFRMMVASAHLETPKHRKGIRAPPRLSNSRNMARRHTTDPSRAGRIVWANELRLAGWKAPNVCRSLSRIKHTHG